MSGPTDWIEWAGGERPVDPCERVEVKYRSLPRDDQYAVYSAAAGFFAWWHDGDNDDIIAYRVVQS